MDYMYIYRYISIIIFLTLDFIIIVGLMLVRILNEHLCS